MMQELSISLRNELNDPRLANVTITTVKPTADLKSARVYYSVLGDETDREQAQKAMEKAKGAFKKAISQNLHLRYLPDLTFFYDETMQKAQRIEELLMKIHDEDETDI